MNQARYKHKGIRSVESLSKFMGISPDRLLYVSSCSNGYYQPNKPEPKGDGTFRQTYSVSPELKHFQNKIVKKFFYNVEYPLYLQGSIRDKASPRSSQKNADMHLGAYTVFSEDITNFFPSINADLVFDMWACFFNCSDECAKVLTNLTVLNGGVPQGASTSSYIANLVFWRRESKMAVDLSEKGLVYSRYVDDVTISSKSKLTNKDKSEVVQTLLGFFKSYSVQIKRRKHDISSCSTRMMVNKLNVNGKHATINKKERGRIRAAVYQCREMREDSNSNSAEYDALYASTHGRVQWMKTLHPIEAGKLLQELKSNASNPHLDGNVSNPPKTS